MWIRVFGTARPVQIVRYQFHLSFAQSLFFLEPSCQHVALMAYLDVKQTG